MTSRQRRAAAKAKGKPRLTGLSTVRAKWRASDALRQDSAERRKRIERKERREIKGKVKEYAWLAWQREGARGK